MSNSTLTQPGFSCRKRIVRIQVYPGKIASIPGGRRKGGDKMGENKQSKIHQLIQGKSRRVTDPAGRKAPVLDDDQALKIAGKCRRSVHKIYTEGAQWGRG